MLTMEDVIGLRMERQHLESLMDESEYVRFYREVSPVQSTYWCGFGQPPSIAYRGDFDDVEFNRERQRERILVKGRFQGGNVGYIEAEEMELFAGLYRKPYRPTEKMEMLYSLICREGPVNIGVIKEMTGMLVKEITPVLHKLQECFLVFEDQYDGDWDRGWYRFEEMFPQVKVDRYTPVEALKIMIQRFAYRAVAFTMKEVKSFYRVTEKLIRSAVEELLEEQVLKAWKGQFLLGTDWKLLEAKSFPKPKGIYVLHRNDFLVKCKEYLLKEEYRSEKGDILEYIMIDGEFCGAVLGRFTYGPYEIEDVVVEWEGEYEQQDILQAIKKAEGCKESRIKRFKGVPLDD